MTSRRDFAAREVTIIREVRAIILSILNCRPVNRLKGKRSLCYKGLRWLAKADCAVPAAWILILCVRERNPR